MRNLFRLFRGGCAVGALVLSVAGRAAPYVSIRPGAEWLDTDGNPIQAHGGSIITVGDTYYWYGENKAKTDGVTRLGSKNRLVWHWGVNLYSSKDLYNWKYEGNVIAPNLVDESSPLHPTQLMDRPHILYNDRTKKFVCYLKIMQHDASRTLRLAPRRLQRRTPDAVLA